MPFPPRLTAILLAVSLGLSSCNPVLTQQVHGSGSSAQEDMDVDLMHLVSSCGLNVALPDDVKAGQWKIHFHWETEFMGPHPVEEVRATLFHRGSPVLPRWSKTYSLDEAWRVEFCDAATSLTQQTFGHSEPLDSSR
jgi:hypothetical protein